MTLKNKPVLAGLVIAGAVVLVGIIKQLGLLDGDTANTAISMLIGLIAGGAVGANTSRTP